MGEALTKTCLALAGTAAAMALVFVIGHAVCLAALHYGCSVLRGAVPLYETFVLPWVQYAAPLPSRREPPRTRRVGSRRLRAQRALPSFQIRVQSGPFDNALAVGGLGAHLVVIGDGLVAGLSPAHLRAVVTHESLMWHAGTYPASSFHSWSLAARCTHFRREDLTPAIRDTRSLGARRRHSPRGLFAGTFMMLLRVSLCGAWNSAPIGRSGDARRRRTAGAGLGAAGGDHRPASRRVGLGATRHFKHDRRTPLARRLSRQQTRHSDMRHPAHDPSGPRDRNGRKARSAP